MNKFIFQDLYIIDRKNSKSFHATFSNEINVITSSEVSLGKSTIIKTLYYTLGAELNFGELPIKNLITIVTFMLNNNKYFVIRNDKNFFLHYEGETTLFTSTSEFGKALSLLLGYEITIEKNESLHTAPPVFYFIPYYIDQINGWTVNPQSFLNMGQFNKTERDLMIYYHLGIFGKTYSDLLSEKNNLQNNIKNDSRELEKNKDLSGLLLEEMNNLVELNNVDSVFFQSIKTEYANIGNQVNKLKLEILDLLNEKANIKNTITNIKSVINNKNKDKNILKESSLKCPHCDEFFSPTDNDIFDANFIIVDLEFEVSELNKVLLTLQKQIDKKESVLKKHIFKIKELEMLKSKENISFETMIQSKGIEKTRNSILNKIIHYDNEITKYNVDLKSVNSKITEINKKKEDADIHYTNYYKKYLSAFSLYNEPMLNFEKIMPKDTFSSTGAVQVLLNLTRFYATIDLLNYYKFAPALPIVIDSPKSGEQSFSNNQLIIENLTQHFNVSNQRIIATIDYKKPKNSTSIKVIELSNAPKKLLSKSNFLENQAQIKYFLQTYDATLNDKV